MRLLLTLVAAVMLLTLVVLPVVPVPYTLETTPRESELFFMASQRVVWRCVDVTWQVDNIRAILVNDAGRIGKDSERVCLSPGAPDITFDITYLDGERQTFTLPVIALLAEPATLGVLALAGLLLVAAWVPTPARPQLATNPTPTADTTTSAALGVLANLMVMLVGLGVALLIADVAMGHYLRNIASDDVFFRFASRQQIEARTEAEGLKTIFVPHLYTGYALNPDHPLHNSLGYRGPEVAVPKPAGTYRIVLLGGSTTYSGGMEDTADTLPARLQALLQQRGHTQVEVVNAGVSGYSSFESVANLQYRVLDLQPDLMMVYHGINDIHTRLVWPPEAYRGDNSGRRVDRALSVPYPEWWEYSNLLRVAYIAVGATEPFSAISRTTFHTSPTSYSSEFEQQNLSGNYPRGIFEEASAMAMLDANPPVYFEQNLRNMVAIAAVNDIDVVLATFAYSPDFSDEPWVNTEAYQRGYDESNAVVRAVAEDTDADLYDFATEMLVDTIYFTDGRHFTAEGNRYRANLYADYLIAGGYLPEQTATARE